MRLLIFCKTLICLQFTLMWTNALQWNGHMAQNGWHMILFIHLNKPNLFDSFHNTTRYIVVAVFYQTWGRIKILSCPKCWKCFQSCYQFWWFSFSSNIAMLWVSSDWFLGWERVQLFELNFISGILLVQYFGDAHSIILQSMYDES